MGKRLEKWFDGRKWEELSCFYAHKMKTALHVWWNYGGYENPDACMARIPGIGKLYALYDGETIFEMGITPDERYWNECREVYRPTPYQQLMMSGDGYGIFEEQIEKVEAEIVEELKALIDRPSTRETDIIEDFIEAIRIHIGGYINDDEMLCIFKNSINKN